MCFFNLNRFYVNLLKKNREDLLEELEDYKELYFKTDDKLRELRFFMKNRKEEFDNASEESKNNISAWHYEMLINNINRIINRK